MTTDHPLHRARLGIGEGAMHAASMKKGAGLFGADPALLASLIEPLRVSPLTGDDPGERGRPSQHGAALGEALADIAKAGAVGTDLLSAMCATCAFREGSLANQLAGTGVVALNCVLGVDPDDFACHHGMKNGEPTKLCAGFLAAQLAPREIVLAAVQLVSARLAALPDHDAVRAAFDEKAARFDPDGRMDNYQWGRALLRDGAA